MTLRNSKLTALLLALTLAGPVGATTGPTITAYSASPSLITVAGAFQHNVASAFDDYVHFSVGSNGGVGWSAASTNSPGFAGLTSFASALYAGTWSPSDVLPGSIATGASGYASYSPLFSAWGTYGGTAGALAAGDYTLRLYGDVESLGGSYAGTIALAPAPILSSALPVGEPGEWALMLSGIGLIGLMVGRRR